MKVQIFEKTLLPGLHFQQKLDWGNYFLNEIIVTFIIKMIDSKGEKT